MSHYESAAKAAYLSYSKVGDPPFTSLPEVERDRWIAVAETVLGTHRDSTPDIVRTYENGVKQKK